MRHTTEDNRTSDQMLTDIVAPNEIRKAAERFERRGDRVTALLFRNNAWLLETGRSFLADVSIRETTQLPARTTEGRS